MDTPAVVKMLLQAERLYSHAEILSRPSPVPRAPGLYAWYFAQVPPGVPVDACRQINGHTLLYIGISPKAPPQNGGRPSRQSLRHRVRYHMRGNAAGSTLRLTLGCLLAEELGIELRLAGSGKRMTFGEGEERLSEWLDRNARVAWLVHEAPWEVEPELICKLSTPLNLDHNAGHPFCLDLRKVRAAARERARALPVLGR